MKAFLLASLAVIPALFPAHLSADNLPMLGKQPWIAAYVGYTRKDFKFSVTNQGVGQLVPVDAKGTSLNSRNAIRFQPVVEEVLADGKVIIRSIEREGWEAVTPAAADPESVTYRGTVKGGGKFEVNLEFDGDVISAGGRLIENGTLKNPRFVLRVMIPNVYSYDKDPEKLRQKTRKDRVEILRKDGKKLKLDVMEALDAETEEYNGPGIAQARIELEGYRGARFDLNAGPTGSFAFWNRGAGALYEGFTLGWSVEEGKDPKGTARLKVEVR